MHIKNYVEVFAAAPVDQAVQQFIARTFKPRPARLRYKQPVTEGHSNRIESGLLEKMDVVSVDVIVAVCLPELSRLIFADKLIDGGLNQSWRIRRLELKHVAFGKQPVAETNSFQ